MQNFVFFLPRTQFTAILLIKSDFVKNLISSIVSSNQLVWDFDLIQAALLN